MSEKRDYAKKHMRTHAVLASDEYQVLMSLNNHLTADNIRLENERNAYRAALDSITQFVANRLKTAEQQRLNTFDFGDFGMSAQLATAATIYRDVQEAVDKALAAYPKADEQTTGGGE